MVRINCPGGSPVQAQTIYDEMRRLREKYPDIPLYAVVEDICASGGYFVAVGADRIYVGKASIVGSIGVLMNGFGFTGLMDKLGVERRLITAGENKGMLDPFSPLDEKDVAAREAADGRHPPAVHRRGARRPRQAPEGDAGHLQRPDLDRPEERRARPRRRPRQPRVVAREVVKAEDIVDFTQKESIAEKFAKRFGAGAASALVEIALRALSASAMR